MFDPDSLIRTDELFDGHYRLLRLLSTDSAAADAWLAADLSTLDQSAVDSNDESSATLVVIKRYRTKNALDTEGAQRFRTEYEIAHGCQHPNLLPPEGFAVFKGMPYVILPYCETGSSEQLIGHSFTTDNAWKFVSDVAAGLNKLHSNQPIIIHQDIKPANILIDNNGNYTITDFSISSKAGSTGIPSGNDKSGGNLAYMAPERFGKDYTPRPQSDIWAFGATICEIFSGRVPFGKDGGLSQKKHDKIEPSLSHLPLGIRNLIKDCLQLDPEKRPTAHEIMETARSKGKAKKRIGLVATGSTVALIAIGIAWFSITKKNPQNRLYSFEQVEALLYQQETCAKGLHLLDSLVKANDYQAAFLMSRLYFDTSDPRDTCFYQPLWHTIRENCGIETNNKTAHELLFKAFELNSSDPILLYQLGYDYHSGSRRGCERDANYALWCYGQAENALDSSTDPNTERYITLIQEQKNKILSDPSDRHSAQRPLKP